MTAATQTPSCSEAEDAGSNSFKYTKGEAQRLAKLRAPPRKRKPNEPTIEEQLRPVPRQLEALEMAPSAQATASAKEWLEDIELIRGRSSYQGVLSKRIRERVTALTRIIDVLATRIEFKEDIEYQKRRNVELQAQLRASQRDVARLNRRVDELQRALEEIRRYMVTDGSIPKFDKATSPLEKVDINQRKSNLQSENSVVTRPPLKGISVPIPTRENKDAFKSEDAEITKQIVELVTRRKQLRKSKQNTSSDRLIPLRS